MEVLDTEVEELKRAFGKVSVAREGDRPYVRILQLSLPSTCTPAQCDVLLCPASYDGYNSRLYFSQKIASTQTRNNLNWQTARILEQDWHTISWKLNSTELRLIQMLMMQLDALR